MQQETEEGDGQVNLIRTTDIAADSRVRIAQQLQDRAGVVLLAPEQTFE